MPALSFDGVDDIARFDSLATALANTSGAAHTLFIVARPHTAASAASYDGLLSLGDATTGIKSALERASNTGVIYWDSSQSTPDVTSSHTITTNVSDYWILVVARISDTAATTSTRFHWRNLSQLGNWTHSDATSSVAAAFSSSATALRIACYSNAADLSPWVYAACGAFNYALSDAQVEAAFGANGAALATSDIWTASGGAPVALIECNVAAASLVDLAGNATSIAVGGAPTLNTGEAPANYTFDGTGVVLQQILPDADVTTTGWSTTPLWSKLSDDSDATVITATLA